jgi:uncharacterized protein YjbI with pentapeptide repeats
MLVSLLLLHAGGKKRTHQLDELPALAPRAHEKMQQQLVEAGRNHWRVDLEGAMLAGADLQLLADIDGFAGNNINLRRANLTHAEMGMAESYWSSINRKNLSVMKGAKGAKGGAQNSLERWANSNVRPPNVDLREAVMDHADLRGVNLPGAPLQGASMRAIDLQGAQLSKAKLQDARLQTLYGEGDGWDWKVREGYRRTNLQDVSFYLADLTGADMTGAILDDAELRQAIMKGASHALLVHQ